MDLEFLSAQLGAHFQRELRDSHEYTLQFDRLIYYGSIIHDKYIYLVDPQIDLSMFSIGYV